MAGRLPTNSERSSCHEQNESNHDSFGCVRQSGGRRTRRYGDRLECHRCRRIAALAQGLPHARVMGYMHAAIFDAVNAVERKYTPFAVDVNAPKASAEAAAATAAHGMLLRFYPLEKAALDARLQASLATVTDDSEAKNEGIELGRTVAEQVFERSRSDQYDVPALPYVPGTDPWSWQFTAPGMVARGVTWGGSKPFILNSPDQFAFAGPHKVTSPDYAKDIEE